MIKYEKNVIEHLDLPNIPKKEWDGTSPITKGVGVVSLCNGDSAYVVVAYNPDKEKKPHVVKTFGIERFSSIEKIFTIPNYMATDVEKMDLDAESKKKAKEIIDEAKEIENDGTEKIKAPEYEYVFEHIHNDEEAVAFIAAYNKRNRINGRVPKKHENIIMRLISIKANMERLTNQNENKKWKRKS